MSQVAHLKKLLAIHQRNLEILKERAALQSVDVPVSVVNQITGEEEAIEDIKTQLANLGVAPEEASTPAAGGASTTSPPNSGGGGINIHAGGDVKIDGALFGRDAEDVQLNITKTENPDLAQIAELFTELYQDIDKSAVPLKEPVKDLTQQLEEEVTQPNSEPDEAKVEGLLKAIQAMAPDIFEVAITTFANPAAGAAMVISKIGERIKAEAGS
jgi:hypothetical protein